MGPIWGRQDPGGPHVGPINFAIWDAHTTLNMPFSLQSNVIFHIFVQYYAWLRAISNSTQFVPGRVQLSPTILASLCRSKYYGQTRHPTFKEYLQIIRLFQFCQIRQQQQLFTPHLSIVTHQFSGNIYTESSTFQSYCHFILLIKWFWHLIFFKIIKSAPKSIHGTMLFIYVSSMRREQLKVYSQPHIFFSNNHLYLVSYIFFPGSDLMSHASMSLSKHQEINDPTIVLHCHVIINGAIIP